MPVLRLFVLLFLLFLCHCAVRSERSLRDDSGSLGEEVLAESTFDPNAFDKDAKEMVKDMTKVKEKLKTAVKRNRQKKPSDDVLKKLQFFLADPERAKEQLKLFLAQDAATIQEAIKEVMCPANASTEEGGEAHFDAKVFATDLAELVMAWAATLKGKRFSDSGARINSATAYIFTASGGKSGVPVGALVAAAIQFLKTSSVVSREAIKTWVAKTYPGKVKDWLAADQSYQTIVAFCQSEDTLDSSIVHASRDMDPAFIAPIALVSLASIVAAVALVNRRLRQSGVDGTTGGEYTTNTNPPDDTEKDPTGVTEKDPTGVTEKEDQAPVDAEKEVQAPDDAEKKTVNEEIKQKEEKIQKENERQSALNANKIIFDRHRNNYKNNVKKIFIDYSDFVSHNQLKDPDKLKDKYEKRIKDISVIRERYKELAALIDDYHKNSYKVFTYVLKDYNPDNLPKTVDEITGKFLTIENLAIRLWGEEGWKAQLTDPIGNFKIPKVLGVELNSLREKSDAELRKITAYEGALKKLFPRYETWNKGFFAKDKNALLGDPELSYEKYAEHLGTKKKETSHEFYHYLDQVEKNEGGSIWELPVLQTLVVSSLGLSGSDPLLDDLRSLFRSLRRALAKKKRLRPLRHE